MKVRLKLLIAYDGRPFRGWQSQASGDAIQDHLESAFAQLCGSRIVVHGAGRTDAGVHALGQVAHVDVADAKTPMRRWLRSINAFLPNEIRVLRVTRAASDFHARFDAAGKIYTYRVWSAPYLHPLEIGRAWFLPADIDRERLRQCATKLVGRHDFAGFAANRGTPPEDTTRTIEEITVRASGPLITLRFRGEGFLYKMVRILTGSLMRCAQGRAEPEWLDELLAGKGRVKSNATAPAEGLYLTRVLY